MDMETKSRKAKRRPSPQEKKEALVLELIQEQLAWFGHTKDINQTAEDNPNWYELYRWHTAGMEKAFKMWATDKIANTLRIPKKTAEREFSWFFLNWGLSSR
jgi:hypothetical protein